MLSRIRSSMSDKDQGFTLIELLVVIIIIGILAAIAIPVFLNQRKKGVDASLKSDLRNVALAMEAYYVDKQAYPREGYLTGGLAGDDFTANDQTVKVTYGNYVAVEPAGGGVKAGTFCLWANGPGSSGVLYYDSDAGGLRKRGDYCA